MDPTQIDPAVLAALLANRGFQQYEHPLARAFGANPMYGGTQIQAPNMLGIPGMNNGPMGMISGMLLQGVLPGLMGPNYMPGQFSPTQNLFDYRMGMQHFIQQRQAMAKAAEADKETYFRMLRGSARMSGVEFNQQQAEQARKFAGDIAGLAPVISAFAPELFDQLHGIRGSAQMMAPGIFEGGRYRFDPVSGNFGYSGATAGAVSNELHGILYGPGADISRMKGIGARQAGALFDEMTRRGFGPTTFNREEQRAGIIGELARPGADIASPELRKLKEKFGISGADNQAINKLGAEIDKLDPQAFEAATRSFDASRAAKSIQRMSGAVAAMRDIFGDMGRPNAPMVELLNGLQALTQGGLTTMSPEKVEQSVRNTYAIAKATGLGLQGIMGFQGTAAQILAQSGASRSLAVPVADSSAAFGAAFGLSAQPTGFDNLGKDAAAQLDIRLRAQAAASMQAVRLGAAMQFADRLARTNKQGDLEYGFAPGSEAKALTEAVRAGKSTYDFGGRKNISVFQNASRLTDILVAGGAQRSDVTASFFNSPKTYTQQIYDYGIADLVKTGQAGIDSDPLLAQVLGNTAQVSLRGKGLSGAALTGTAGNIGSRILREARALRERDPKIFSGGRERERNAAIADAIAEELGEQLGMTRDQVINLVDTTLRQGENYIVKPGSPLGGYGTLSSYLGQTSPKIQAQANKILANTRATAKLQAALSGIGQANVVQRLSDYLQTVGADSGNLEEFIFGLVGAVPTKDVANNVTALLNQVTKLQTDYEKTDDNTERERILSEIKLLGKDVNNAVLGNPNLSPKARDVISNYNKSAKTIADLTQGPPEPGTRNVTSTTNPKIVIPDAGNLKTSTNTSLVKANNEKDAATGKMGPSDISGELRIIDLDRALLTGKLLTSTDNRGP